MYSSCTKGVDGSLWANLTAGCLGVLHDITIDGHLVGLWYAYGTEGRRGLDY